MKKYPKCSPYDLRALENWLAQLAAEGFELTEEWQKFREGEKREKQFYIEPAEKDEPPAQTLRASRALMGWEYVCPMNKGAFYVWRSLDATASVPRARELAGSWCDRWIGRRLLHDWLGLLAPAAFIAGFIIYDLASKAMPLWALLTSVGLQSRIVSLLLTMFCIFFQIRWEQCDLKRLRRAVRAGEQQEPVPQRRFWYGAMNWLPQIVALVILFLPLDRMDGGIRIWDDVPYLSAEELGGAAEYQGAERYNTLLCRSVVVQEGGYRGYIGKYTIWSVHQTQMEVYHPHFAALAEPLEAELLTFHAKDCQVEALADTVYYWQWADGVQCILLRDGDMVLFYHTDAPDDLRGHMDEFAALLEAYR